MRASATRACRAASASQPRALGSACLPRLSGEERARAQYEDAVAQHRMRVDEAQRARDQARAQRRWLACLRSALAIRRERRAAPGPAVVAGRVSAQLARLERLIVRDHTSRQRQPDSRPGRPRNPPAP